MMTPICQNTIFYKARFVVLIIFRGSISPCMQNYYYSISTHINYVQYDEFFLFGNLCETVPSTKIVLIVNNLTICSLYYICNT